MAKRGNVVKQSKNSIRLLILLLLVAGVAGAVVTLTANTEEREQEALVQEAQVFLQDKLYIRAVNNYKAALSDYQTEQNPQLEKELVALYLEAGMLEEYYSLIEERIEAERADEEEYLAIARHYLEEGSEKNAITVLQDGIRKFQNQEMIQLREQTCYAYKTRTVNTAALGTLGDSVYIPAFDGDKWGYISTSGDILLDFIYEEATDFCGDYAVVKLDGVYTLIDKNGYWNAVDKNSLERVTDISSSAIVGFKDGVCRIYSRTFQPLSEENFEQVYLNDNGLYVVQNGGKWAILSEELEAVTDYIFMDVAVNSLGNVFCGNYAVVKDQNGYVLINQEGEPMYEARFSDAKGFEGGLYAVADADGSWGFANEKAELVVDYQYVDAHSFSCDLAAVEYAGKWGYINRYNTMVIEASYTQASPFRNGTAIVGNDLGASEILTLKYFELFGT